VRLRLPPVTADHARRVLGLASIVQTVPGLALWRCSNPLLLALASVSLACSGLASPHSFPCRRAGVALYTMLPVLAHHHGLAHAIPQQGVTPCASLSSGFHEPRDEWRGPSARGGLGDRHRDAVDPDRPDQPRPITFSQATNPELGVLLFGCLSAACWRSAVDQTLALIGVRPSATAAGRPHGRSGGIGVAALVAGDGWCQSLCAFAVELYLAPRPLPSNMCCRRLIAQRLRAEGLSATTRESLGFQRQLRRAGIRRHRPLCRLLRHAVGQPVSAPRHQPREELLRELKATLAQQNVTLLGELGFENAYRWVMPRRRAEALGIRSIADLASHAQAMSIAGDYEFFSRPEWGDCGTPMDSSFARSGRCSRTSCMPRQLPAMSM